MLSIKSTLEGIAENLPCFSGQPNFSFSATVHPPKCMVELDVVVASALPEAEADRYSAMGLAYNADEWITKIIIDLFTIKDFGPDQMEMDGKMLDTTRITTDYHQDMVLVIEYKAFKAIYEKLTGIHIHKMDEGD